MNWVYFVNNVQCWAKDRGIYDHSTPEAQLMKTLSEGGEIADAIIKGDRKGIYDGIGDAAVCLINYATMADIDSSDIYDFQRIEDHQEIIDSPNECIGYFFKEVSNLITGEDQADYETAIGCLLELCNLLSISFMECCEQAWNEIKDRKGFLSPSGAFVKDE